VNVADYAKPMMTALEEQDMHDTDKFTMSATKFNSLMQQEKLKEKAVLPDKPIANATSPANSSPALSQPTNTT
jgi:hypothetical protein